MITAGLDIGSRTIALVEWDGKRILREKVVDTGVDPLTNSRAIMDRQSYDRLVATGYGRHLAVERSLADEVITEIKAYGIGAHHLYPDVRTILDIGGQDCKVILVKPGGGVAHFEMNDRCAAGTGRFLENMARALGMELDGFSHHALEAEGKAVRLSSMCTVFAESEVVSMIGRGEDSRRVVLGIHQAIVSRISAMVKRVGYARRFVFAGGGARSLCLQRLIAQELGISLSVPENPQTVGALGAAIHAANGLRTIEGDAYDQNH
jgi:predicted CoA-substrate-specific enzyme activase